MPLLCAGPGLRWQSALAVTLAVQLFWATASGTSQRSLRQAVCDPAFQGRMQSASTTLTAGARPLAAATAGALVLLLDVRATLAVGALLQIVPVVLLLASPIRALRTIPARAVPPAMESMYGTTPGAPSGLRSEEIFIRPSAVVKGCSRSQVKDTIAAGLRPSRCCADLQINAFV
ncbi:hypothetical protein ACFVOK_38685 [Streptomyces sp. NPDC057798]|uniref:hypothetical protein n=1 Tax=Streptomyces sp. NPDC057798 TaxID=3346252 RepID=UPI00369306F8